MEPAPSHPKKAWGWWGYWDLVRVCWAFHPLEEWGDFPHFGETRKKSRGKGENQGSLPGGFGSQPGKTPVRGEQGWWQRFLIEKPQLLRAGGFR